MRKVAIFILLFLLSFSNLRVIYATDSTPSASIQSKLDALKQEIASKAAVLKKEINKKLQNKAFVGVIKSKSLSSITVAASIGPKIISVNQDTIFETNKKLKKKLTIDTLSPEDYIAALGDVDDTGVLTAKKIVLLTDSTSPKSYLLGQIASISDSSVIIKDKSLKNFTVSIDKKTDLKSGEEIILLSDIKVSNFVVITGITNQEVLQAQFIYLLPNNGIIKPKKLATPSAQIATPSAKKK